MGRIFKRTLGIIEDNKQRIESGLLNCIPMPFERFGSIIPGIEERRYTIVTASSGVGKSKFVKYMYVASAFEQWRKNRDALNLKIFYFCLEESKESFMMSLISYRLFMEYGLMISSDDLSSKRYAVTDEVILAIQECEGYFDELEEVMEIIDNIRIPYSIYMHVSEYMEKHGTWSFIPYIDPKDKKEKQKHDYFTHEQENTYTLVVIDHINLLMPESKLSMHETLTRFSSGYCVNLRDKYRCSVVAVQQQAADKEKLMFNLWGGKNIDEKLEPSLDGLGDNKLTQRDADLVLGLFGPARYPISNHRGYDIARMGDSYRSLMVLKNRYGPPNARIGLHFLGAVGAFAELPKASEMDDKMYDDVMRNYSLFNNG
jgi:replicative DNA helicase